MLAACLDAVESTALDTEKINTSIDQLIKVRFRRGWCMAWLSHPMAGTYVCFFRTRESFFCSLALTPFRDFGRKIGDQDDD